MSATTALPDGWAIAIASEILGVTNGYAFSTSDWSATGLPIIRIQNLNDPDAPFNHFSGELPDKFLVRSGDLLFAWSGTPGTSFGAHIWRGEQAWLNQHIFKVEFDENQLDKRYLRLAINHNLAEYVSAAHGGAGLAHITKTSFEGSSILIPPLAEQRRIVAESEKQFSRLDAADAALRRVVARLKRLGLLVLDLAIRGMLVPNEASLARLQRRDFEDAALLLKRIYEERQRSRPAEDSQFSFVDDVAAPIQVHGGTLPEGWAWAQVDQLGEVKLGRQRSPPHHSGPDMRPYLRVANVYEDRLDLSDVLEMNFDPEDFATYRLQDGDILLNEGQSLELVGRPAMFRGELEDVCFQNTLVRFRPSGLIEPEFALVVFRAYFHSNRFQRIARTSTNIAHLGAGRFAALEFPLPPRSEQERIVGEVHRRQSLLAQVETVTNASLKRTARLRRALLHRAFEGKLVPQHATDEPGTVLLERLRDERARTAAAVRAARKEQVVPRVKREKRPRRPLLEVLQVSGLQSGMTPEDLFRDSGHDADSVDEFYAELKTSERSGLLKEERRDGEVRLVLTTR